MPLKSVLEFSCPALDDIGSEQVCAQLERMPGIRDAQAAYTDIGVRLSAQVQDEVEIDALARSARAFNEVLDPRAITGTVLWILRE